jgi:hypothetical protein
MLNSINIIIFYHLSAHIYMIVHMAEARGAKNQVAPRGLVGYLVDVKHTEEAPSARSVDAQGQHVRPQNCAESMSRMSDHHLQHHHRYHLHRLLQQRRLNSLLLLPLMLMMRCFVAPMSDVISW